MVVVHLATGLDAQVVEKHHQAAVVGLAGAKTAGQGSFGSAKPKGVVVLHMVDDPVMGPEGQVILGSIGP